MARSEIRDKRKKRVRKKIFGTGDRPRLSMFRSNKHIYGQCIDDEKKVTLASMSDFSLSAPDRKGKRSEIAKKVGEKLGDALKKKKITHIVFDRAGYKYHGRIKAFADGVRKAGIKF